MLFESCAIVKCLKSHCTELIAPHTLYNENALKILLELVVTSKTCAMEMLSNYYYYVLIALKLLLLCFCIQFFC